MWRVTNATRRCTATRACPAFTRPRAFHDYLKVSTGDGRFARIPLNSQKVIGSADSRGTRDYREDCYTACAINISPEELRISLNKNHGMVWDPGKAGGDALASQLLYVGIYDGHGGQLVSQFLQKELHRIFEEVQPPDVPQAVSWLKSHGGYFKRYKGGTLIDWTTEPPSDKILSLEQRAELAFIEADRKVSFNEEAENCGSTVSVALLQSVDSPAKPFYLSRKLALTVAHCGDTRVLLCSTDGGKVTPMTEYHHADARREASRLRRMGGGLVTDSFGDARWMGALANTRGLGDGRWKAFGVTPEPDMKMRLLHGEEWAYMVLISDGISSMASDQEIVDLARGAADPGRAAKAIVSYAEELGGEDNATALVVPLPGWGKIRGPDATKALREYRKEQAVGSERQRRM